MTGLASVVAWLVAISGVVAGIGTLVATKNWPNRPELSPAILKSVGVALGAMLIGLVPLATILRAGTQHIVAAWTAAMIVRMAGCLIGIVILIKYAAQPKAVVALTASGHYVLLLITEAALLSRLVSRSLAKTE